MKPTVGEKDGAPGQGCGAPEMGHHPVHASQPLFRGPVAEKDGLEGTGSHAQGDASFPLAHHASVDPVHRREGEEGGDDRSDRDDDALVPERERLERPLEHGFMVPDERDGEKHIKVRPEASDDGEEEEVPQCSEDPPSAVSSP